MSKGKKILIGAIIFIIVVAIFSYEPKDRFESMEYPSQEIVVINSSIKARNALKDASNDMQKGNALNQRSADLCSNLKSFYAQDWVGIIDRIDSNSDGLGVLSVEIYDDIFVKTWNNSISDSFHHTLIQPLTPLFNTVANMKKGQAIRFSGFLFRDKTNCLYESSLTLNGKLEKPEFIFQFTSVAPL